jgi:uncharacterized membrane protein required for colicin V production
MFIDIALLILALLIIWIGVRQGFISGVLSLAAWCGAMFLTYRYSYFVAEFLYDRVIREKSIEKVSDILQNEYAFGTAKSRFNDFIAVLSQSLKTWSNALGIQIDSQSILNYNASDRTLRDVCEYIVDIYLADIIINLCKRIVSVVGFVLLIVLFRSIAQYITQTVRSSKLQKADGILGGAVGTAKAVVIVAALAFLIRITSGIFQSGYAIGKLKEPNVRGQETSELYSQVENSFIVNLVSDVLPF